MPILVQKNKITYFIKHKVIRPHKSCTTLRIEIHFLSLHWMMKNSTYFSVCVGIIKVAHVFHHPVQA